MFLYTSINTLNLCGTSNYIQYICKYESLQFLYPVIILLRIYLSFVFILYRLSYIVKALFVGTICHTTDILNAVFCCVHWIKPPSYLYYSNNLIVFVEFIITLPFLFVNTISIFYMYNFSSILLLNYCLNFQSFSVVNNNGEK
mgnify:CR=1 FL=1